MFKRRERTLKELHNATGIISEPEITPVLKGSYQMRGPVDESESNLQTKTASFEFDKRLSKHPKDPKVIVRAESGTCNVCSAPCSSCLHINRVLMGSKVDESSDETYREVAASYSVSDVVSAVKSKICGIGHRSFSETSHPVSGDSTHDSLSQNVESKANLRTSHASMADSNKRKASNEFENSKDLEGHDDNISCVSRCNEAKDFSISDIGNEARKNVPSSSVAPASSLIRPDSDKGVHDQTASGSLVVKCDNEGNQDMMDIPVFKDNDDGACLQNAESKSSCPPNDKSLSFEPKLEDLEEDSGEPLDSYIKKESIEAQNENENENGDQPTEALNCAIEEVEKAASGTSLQSCPMDESEESEALEHDVKVCDICGDAGREDLLAICCKCSDGAEHTYCMRERAEKVPEGDWLCEECKFEEDIKNQKKDKVVQFTAYGKGQSPGQAGTDNSNPCSRSDAKGSDVDENRANKDFSKAKVSGKRHLEDAEVSSVSKKQALETTVGSSKKISSPHKIPSLSRDNSFKNLDRGKVKPVHQPSSVIDAAEAARPVSTGPRSPHTARGNLMKYNSFSFGNQKPKVKLADEVVPQKPKLAREPASLDTREGAVGLLSKSVSFKHNSGRLNSSESKVKMLSPKYAPGHDLKRLKHAKERNVFEKRSSFKSDRPSNSDVSSSNADQKPVFRSETILVPSSGNNHEPKPVQTDGKSISLSKSCSLGARRGAEMLSLLGSGEIKRQSSCLRGAAGSANASGFSTAQKPFQASAKNDASSTSFIAERPLCNASEGMKESNATYLKENKSVTGKTPTCQKCKEIGHSEEFCTVDSNHSLVPDSSIARNSREEMIKGNGVKAAIEAAMLKKPGIYRKNKASDQSDELSASRMNCEMAATDKLSTSGYMKPNHAEEIHGARPIARDSAMDSSRNTTVNKPKQLTLLTADVSSFQTGDISLAVPSNGKPPVKDLPSQASAALSPLLEISVIPEFEWIWQGAFEIHRSTKSLDSCDRIQAHLSTCASPRVLDAVNNFPPKVILNEVPRLSVWPLQFQESGVKEDNIALYFFAKDIESYEKSYSTLLDNMMRSDLALKGIVDDVELLIFPSNQLPENSQRWNMLFFLWGVFKGKKSNGLQQAPALPKNLPVTAATVISLPDNECSLGPMHKTSPAAGACSVDIASERINGDSDKNSSSLAPKDGNMQTNVEQHDSDTLSTTQTRSDPKCQEMTTTRVSLEEQRIDPNCKEAENPIKKRALIDLTIPWNGVSPDEEESPIKKQKSDYFPCELPPENTERYFFPVNDGNGCGGFGESSIQWKPYLAESPNLDLALGGVETKPAKQVLPPFLGGKVKEERGDEGDESISAALSLSLSFPFPEQESVSKSHVNTPLLLFRDK